MSNNVPRSFEDHLCKYATEIDGKTYEWYWLKEDKQAFGYILEDWVNIHRKEYFKHIDTFGTMVQAGGNCGMYPRFYSELFKTVYTFEPDPLNFFMLSLNCQSENIVKFQAALGDRHAMVDIWKPDPTNVGMHRTKENPAAVVPQFKIDDLELTDCSFIQLDIELYEINALRGAYKTLKKFKPVIAIENYTPEIDEFLRPLGYTVVGTSYMDTIVKCLDQ